MQSSFRFWNNSNSILGMITNRERNKPASYSRMKEKQIAKRRAKNKMAFKSRRINRLRS